MPIYKVKAPDGSVMRFEGPENATQEQVVAAAKAQFESMQTAAAAKSMEEQVMAATDLPQYGARPDGTQKGQGFLGAISLPTGGVATEYTTQSDAVTVNGQRIDFPTLVPTLTQQEVELMRSDIIPNQKPIPESIMQKAIQHANSRLASGLPVFADQAAPAPQREFIGQSIPQAITAPIELAATGVTGATTGMLGYAAGAGAGLIESIRNGTYGTRVGGQQMAQRAMQGLERYTYAPRTQMAQEALQAVGELAEEAKLAPVPVTAVPQTLAVPAARAAQAAGTQAAEAVMRAPGTISSAISRQEAPAMPGSAGAAATEAATRRAATAEMMPVPFAGPSGLTVGQATRSFADLQFEKEAAKIPDLGEPLRERLRNQNLTLLQNFDALIDLQQPLNMTKPEIGAAVTEAVVNKANVAKKRISDAYRKAEEEGELLEELEMSPFAQHLTETETAEGVAPIIASARKEAVRLGAIEQAPDGTLVPKPVSLSTAETLRKFVNKYANQNDPTSVYASRELIKAIDNSTEGYGGEIYKKARKLRKQYGDEFERTALTQKLLGTKGKTTERQIAVENVFDKVVRLSSVEEMNKLRGTLLTAGPEGKQAWTDLKAQGIAFIRDAAMTRATDESGQRVFSAPAMQKAVESFDKSGKLEALYGKRQAQVFRDLADIAQDIYTAPPGAINTSSTASALMTAVDTLATFGISGLPVPAKAAITEAVKYARDRKVKQRIERALQGPRVEQK